MNSYIRKCPKCNKELKYSSRQGFFNANKKKVNCNKCGAENRNKNRVLLTLEEKKLKSKLRTRKFKLKLQLHIWKFLLNNPCVDCGEANIMFLEFDHVDKKTEWISWLIRKHASIKKIDSEIKKCEIRCIGCHRKKTKKSYKNIRNSKQAQFVKNFLMANSCRDCGEDDIILLDFDHIKDEKYQNISTLVGNGRSKKIIEREMEKCEVVCVKCHKLRTAKRQKWSILEFLKNTSISIDKFIAVLFDNQDLLLDRRRY